MPGPLFYFQVNQRDWLSSMAIRRLSLAGKGLLFELMCFQWEEGAVPDDPDVIARCVNATPKEVRVLWPEVRRFLESTGEGMVRHADLHEQREETLRLCATRRVAGGKGGRPRGKQNPKQTASNGQPDGYQKGNQTVTNEEANGEADTNQTETNGKPIGFDLVKQTETKPKAIQELEIEVQRTTSSGGEPPAAPTPAAPDPPSRNPDGEPEPGDGEGEGSPYRQVERTLVAAAEAIGWPPPVRKDVVQHLPPESSVRLVIAAAGTPERAAAVFAWAHRNWTHRPTWKSVCTQRHQILEALAEPPKPSTRSGRGATATLDERRAQLAAERAARTVPA